MQLINLIIPFFMVFRSLAVPGPTHVQQHIADRIPKVTEAAFAHLVNRQLPVPTGRPNCDFGTWGPEDGPKLGGLEICGSILATAATQCLDREADGVAAMTQCLMTKTNADVYTTVCRCVRCGIAWQLGFEGVWNEVCSYNEGPPLMID